MITRAVIVMAAVCLAAEPAVVLAQQYAYPSKGQSPERREKDEAACSSWAQKESGFDPSTPPPPEVEGAEKQVTGSGARVVGALGGAAVAGIAGGSAGTGALVGAVGGGLTKRGMNAKKAKKQNTMNAEAYQQASDSYWKARGACLTGRGYSVN